MSEEDVMNYLDDEVNFQKLDRLINRYNTLQDEISKLIQKTELTAEEKQTLDEKRERYNKTNVELREVWKEILNLYSE